MLTSKLPLVLGAFLLAHLGVPGAVALAATPSDSLYTLDGYGGVHGVHGAPPLSQSAYWPNWDIARGLALLPDASGGYVLDGYGGIHPVGSTPSYSVTAYWSGWDIARGIAVRQDGTGGYVLDGWGGIHPFGNVPGFAPSAYWKAWDIARGIALLPDGSGGYVVDGYGGIHPFGAAPGFAPSAYWGGWDIARGIALLPDGSGGYVLDGWGGLHPFGAAPAASLTAYWHGWDIARSVVILSSSTSSTLAAYVVDGWGGYHSVGAAPAFSDYPYWQNWDIVRGAASGSGGTGFRLPPRQMPDAPVWKIVVSLNAQELWAYGPMGLELDTFVTTGRPELPTLYGAYGVFSKASPFVFSSPWGTDSPYWYPDSLTNWAMGFIQGGYYIHDAPWRSVYGPSVAPENRSHGCVNVPHDQMHWLYDHSSVGTEVDITA